MRFLQQWLTMFGLAIVVVVVGGILFVAAAPPSGVSSNGVVPTSIQPQGGIDSSNQELPAGQTQPAGAGEIAPVPTLVPVDTPVPQTRTHTVTSGETLSAIASTYGVTVADIVRENNLADPNSLDVGQELVIPDQ